MTKLNEQRVIIWEGPDGCGKTNMAREYERLSGIPYFKNKGEWANFEKDENYFVNIMKYGDLGFLSQFLHQTKSSAILDRSWPSEWCYAKVFGRKTDEEIMKRLDVIYNSMNARIVIPLRKDYSCVVDQFDSIDEKKLIELHKVYLEFVKWTRCHTLTLFVDDEDLKREMSLVKPFVTSGLKHAKCVSATGE